MNEIGSGNSWVCLSMGQPLSNGWWFYHIYHGYGMIWPYSSRGEPEKFNVLQVGRGPRGPRGPRWGEAKPVCWLPEVLLILNSERATPIHTCISGWWFGTFFIFLNSWDDDPIWLICFRGVKPPTRYCSRIMRAQGLSAPSRSKAVAGRFTTCRLRDCWEPPHFFWACDVWENDHQHPSTIKVRSTRLPDTAIKYTPEGKQPVCCFKELCSFPWATMI